LTGDADLQRYITDIVKQRRSLRICAFGAGPGTELLAFVKFFEEHPQGFPVRLDFQLLDNVREWQDAWYGLRQRVDDYLAATYGPDVSRWPVLAAGNFLQQDVTEIGRVGQLPNVWHQDIYVLNYLLSEVFRDDPGLRAFMTLVAQRAPSGAKFLFVDRRGTMWAERMQRISRASGLVQGPFHEFEGEISDNPLSLGSIYTSLTADPVRGRQPRNSYRAIYGVATKP
jgi:hypothetical protein